MRLRVPRSLPRRARALAALLPLALAGALGALATAPRPAPEASPATDALVARALDRVLERAGERGPEAAPELFAEHASWEDPWEVQTGPWLVRTTHSRWLAADLGRGLEAMLVHFQALLGTDYEPSPPIRIDVHPTLAAYNAFGDEHGEYHSSIYPSFYARDHPERPVATYVLENPTLLRMAVTHSACLAYVERAFGRQPPTWIHMGLAGYFEHYWWAWSWSVDRLEALKREGGFIPLPSLVGAPIDDYGAQAPTRFLELGMLFAWLLHWCEASRGEDGPFAQYLRAVVRGASTTDLPFHELMEEEQDRLEADFRSFEFRKE